MSSFRPITVHDLDVLFVGNRIHSTFYYFEFKIYLIHLIR